MTDVRCESHLVRVKDKSEDRACHQILPMIHLEFHFLRRKVLPFIHECIERTAMFVTFFAFQQNYHRLSQSQSVTETDPHHWREAFETCLHPIALLFFFLSLSSNYSHAFWNVRVNVNRGHRWKSTDERNRIHICKYVCHFLKSEGPMPPTDMTSPHCNHV